MVSIIMTRMTSENKMLLLLEVKVSVQLLLHEALEGLCASTDPLAGERQAWRGLGHDLRESLRAFISNPKGGLIMYRCLGVTYAPRA